MADDVLRTFDGEEATNRKPEKETLSIRSASTSIPISKLVTGEQSDRPIRFQRLQIVPTIDIYAVSAEPLDGLRAFIPFTSATPVGYLGDVFGYWPSDCQANYGGYEAKHFLSAFGLQGQLRRSLDNTFREAVDALSEPN